MKEVKLVAALVLFLIFVLFIESHSNSIALKAGDISFTSFKSKNKDGFSIVTFIDLPPRTIIHFTDSEWNGNRFGFDESDIQWKTGNDVIPAKSIINFTNLNSTPTVTAGSIYGSMNLSSKGDAIFAYLGTTRMPVTFLAAVANNELSYGTLENTNLFNGKTAITYPEGTTFASYKGPNSYQTILEYKCSLSRMSNYKFQ